MNADKMRKLHDKYHGAAGQSQRDKKAYRKLLRILKVKLKESRKVFCSYISFDDELYSNWVINKIGDYFVKKGFEVSARSRASYMHISWGDDDE